MKEQKATQTSRPRLIFIHGAGGDNQVWGSQTSHFANSEAVILPGHRVNETEGNAGKQSVEEYANWLHQYLTAEHNVDHTHGSLVLAGHSMGGAIAMMYALRYPGEVHGLVLVGTGSRLRVPQPLLDGFKKDYPATVHTLMGNLFHPNAPETLRRPIRETLLQLNPTVTHDDFAACNKFDISNELAGLSSVPSLIITGQQDVMTPPKFAQFLSEHIHNAQLEIIADAGHNVMSEKAKEFNELLSTFLRERVTR